MCSDFTAAGRDNVGELVELGVGRIHNYVNLTSLEGRYACVGVRNKPDLDLVEEGLGITVVAGVGRESQTLTTFPFPKSVRAGADRVHFRIIECAGRLEPQFA